jgi:hypothetical protein
LTATSDWNPDVHSLVLVHVTATPGVAAVAGSALSVPAATSTSDTVAAAAPSARRQWKGADFMG